MQAAPSPQQTSVRVENVTSLKGLIQEIESQTSYRISYQGNLADNVPVKIAKSTKSVSQLLDEALRGTGITYIIRQNNIILTRAEAQSPASAAPAAPRKQHIAGQVLDAATRQPIIGATIWIKDSALGTSTASDGSFDYSFSGNFGFVTVSYVGYQTQEFPIDRIPKVISLSPDNNLEEVVVVGYGAQKKASIIGSIASVPVNDIKMPTGKISNNLAGQLAGVISVQRSGEPGASSTFWIRGISTFGSNKSPLVLVDGIERDLDLVDIEDIKEFSILKDAAATAVYGVRGANGVVLVTTRGGIVGKPQINIKFEAGMVQPTKIPDMIDAVQFAEMYNAAAGYDFYSKKDIQMFRDGSDPDLHPNIDWVDRLYKDYSFNQRVNVNISGGGSTAKYYISGGFYNEDGLFKADNMKEYNTSVFYRRFNFRSNVEVQLHKYTKLNINLATTFERKNEPGSSATGANGIWGYALKTAANAFPDVYSNGYLAGPASGQGENPYALLTQTGYREIFYNTAQSLFVLTQDLGDWVTKGLTVSIKGSFDAQNENNLGRTKTSPQWLATGRNEAGELEFNQTQIGEENLSYKQTNKGYRSVYFEAVANWARTFGKHDLSAMFLFQQSQKNYVGESANNSEKALPYRHQGIAGRITYNYDNRYFKDTWEGLPRDGYTAWMERMIDDPRIHVTLGTDFFDESQPLNKKALRAAGTPVVYTGPIDRYFGYELGDLKWRTVDFKEVRYDEDDHFGCPVMNFSDADVPYTRAIEFKNFNPERRDAQNHNRTVVWEEYSRFAERGDEPYYPINTDADKALYERYAARAAAEPNVVFGGRLGTYKYYDMHNVIDAALTAYEEQVAPMLRAR